MENKNFSPEITKYYNNPILVGNWNGYKVYAEKYDGEDAPAIGMPQFLLFKDNKTRLTTEEEAFQIIRNIPEKDD